MRHFGDMREGHSDEESKNVLRILLQYSLYPSIAPYLIPEKRTIFLDFDGTLTVRDTCVRDSVCAYSKDVGLRGNELFFKDSLDRQALYQELLAAYKSTYQGQFDALLQNDTLSGFLKGYDAIDYDCLKPCEDSGLFKGLRRYAVGLTGRLVDLAENAPYFLQHERARSLYVVSQSWYNDMIVNCLCDSVWHGALNVLPGHVFSSSLVYDAQGVATGALDKRCGGCEHKREVMRAIGGEGVRVMIGDSLGDLSCLLEADIGVVMHPSATFRRVCAQYGVALKDLMQYNAKEDLMQYNGKERVQHSEKAERVLYNAKERVQHSEKAEKVLYNAKERVQHSEKAERVLYVCEDWSEVSAVLSWPRMMCDAWAVEPALKADVCSEEACRLMALTNEHLNQVGGEEMEEAIGEAIEGGATMIQIRDKTEDFGAHENCE